MHKDYLGDGVYVEVDQFGTLILTAENGVEIKNIIYLEPAVVDALNRYIDRINSMEK